MFFKYLITPIMGTVIGYGTNYIAVKMLFRPKNEIKLWGHTLPFTPGAIPKGKSRLAKSVGNVVGNTLITKDDIKARFLNENAQNIIIAKLNEILSTEIKTGVMTFGKLNDDSYGELKYKISDTITEQILVSINNMNVSEIISNECSKAVKEKFQHTMLKMFLTDDLISSVTKMLGDEVQKYIDKKGRDLIGEEVKKRIDDIESKSVNEILSSVDISEEKIKGVVTKLYRKSVDKALDKLFAKLNIERIIEDKINSMDMDEMEKLVLEVMKKELDTIVNLGAVIGFLLGLVNMLINLLM